MIGQVSSEISEVQNPLLVWGVPNLVSKWILEIPSTFTNRLMFLCAPASNRAIWCPVLRSGCEFRVLLRYLQSVPTRRLSARISPTIQLSSKSMLDRTDGN